jgi:transcriptional regulator with XRE-family HTH domain
VAQSSIQVSQKESPSSFGERLGFVIWLAGKVLGVDSGKQFAQAIGKRSSQLSRWLKEDPRPEWATIKRMADAVGVSPMWLDEPTANGAVEPDDFPEWLVARRRRLADEDERAFDDGAEIPTLERESFEEEEPPTRATGTTARSGAKKRR